MGQNNDDIKKLISDLMEKPKLVKGNKTENDIDKIVVPGNLLEDDIDDKNFYTYNANRDILVGNNNVINNYIQEPVKNYKRDFSALVVNREITGYRNIGDTVDVKQMTKSEYISYLGFVYKISNVNTWDGIERLHHRPNWTPDFSHDVKSYDEALDFMGIEKNNIAPDGLEKRTTERRQGLKDIRYNKINRRVLTEKGRRKEDLFNYTIYFTVVLLLLLIIITWMAFSFKEFIYG